MIPPPVPSIGLLINDLNVINHACAKKYSFKLRMNFCQSCWSNAANETPISAKHAPVGAVRRARSYAPWVREPALLVSRAASGQVARRITADVGPALLSSMASRSAGSVGHFRNVAG